MAFLINKILAIKKDPLGNKRISDIILKRTEELIRAQKGPIRLFSVDYREIKSTKPEYLMFHIKRAFNERDK